jgi:crotonobetainyl-CoA:carnitine CoA-transferase CaiB-like acyl-CoA transferase
VLLAAPFATTMLADFGAEVIKVEIPGTGDPFGRRGRNKKSVTCDLRVPEGQELFKRLVATADILNENFRPGTMERWNLGWETLSAVNPGLIMMRVTGFGQTGPYRHRPAYGMLFEAYGGLTDSLGFADSPPVYGGYGDHFAALVASQAMLIALYHRKVNGGAGQVIDLAATEAILKITGDRNGTDRSRPLGPSAKRTMERPYMPIASDLHPSGVFECADGKWCQLHPGMFPNTWANLTDLIGRPDLREDDTDRFPVGSVARTDRFFEAADAIKQWILRFPREDVIRMADEHEITIAPVYSVRDAMDDPHFVQRGVFVDIEDREGNVVTQLAPLPHFTETPGRIEHAGPLLGEHNEEIYGSLGISRHELKDLEARKII